MRVSIPLLLAFLVCGAAASAEAPLVPIAVEVLPEKYQTWLEEVAVLISEEEREVFLKLSKDYQRDAFIDRFWRERDPYPDTGRNELKERWGERVELARSSFGKLDDDRAKVLLLNGEPTVRRVVKCRAAFWPLELWFFVGGSDLYRSPFAVVFYQRGGSGAPFRIWHQSYGRDELVSIDREASCLADDNEYLRAAISWIDEQGPIGYMALLQRVSAPPNRGSKEWVTTFSSYSTDLPSGAATFPADVVLEYPGWYQNRTVLQGLVVIKGDVPQPLSLGGQQSYNFVLTGEVLQGPVLFDSFRYKFDFGPDAAAGGTPLPLVFQRYLRPGPYQLILKVEELATGRFFRREQSFDVPKIDSPELSPPVDPRLARVLSEANAAIAAGETAIKLVPPIGDLLTGLVRFDTLVTGSEVHQMHFALNGEPILTKTKPPFSVELDLGDFPRTHTLSVAAVNAAGEEVASDELLVNLAGSRFRVRLLEPHRGKVYQKSLRAKAEVEVPKGEAVERVEFYLNEALVATLFQPPYVQPIVLPEAAGALFVRAVAYRPDGAFAEDVVIINAPGTSEDVSIQLVELYASVLEKSGRPISGLSERDFEVEEDGVPQEIVRFEQVADLPVHAAILLDTSASMAERIEPARAAALSFFENSLRKSDRAALVTFNDRPYLAVPFTNDLKTFAAGLAGLKAERGTALYDSLMYSLFYFAGITGQRALIVLSDGKDESSRFEFDEALDYVRRAGVTVYTVSLGVGKKEIEARKALTRISEETGGRSFFLESIDELRTTYEAIEEDLRAQYLIAYQSKNTSRDRKFRKIEVDVAGRSTEVKTLRGYYP